MEMSYYKSELTGREYVCIHDPEGELPERWIGGPSALEIEEITSRERLALSEFALSNSDLTATQRTYWEAQRAFSQEALEVYAREWEHNSRWKEVVIAYHREYATAWVSGGDLVQQAILEERFYASFPEALAEGV